MLLFCALVLFPVRVEGLTRREATLRYINEVRINHDCGRLVHASDALRDDARAHSRQMAHYGRLFHSELHVGHWSLVGEVVGVAQHWHTVLDLLFQSSTHRHILLDCRYDEIAIGYFNNDQVWMTGRLYAR